MWRRVFNLSRFKGRYRNIYVERAFAGEFSARNDTEIGYRNRSPTLNVFVLYYEEDAIGEWYAVIIKGQTYIRSER